MQPIRLCVNFALIAASSRKAGMGNAAADGILKGGFTLWSMASPVPWLMTLLRRNP